MGYRSGPDASAVGEESVEDHVGRLYRSLEGKGLAEQKFGPAVLHQYLNKSAATAQLAAPLNPYSKRNSLLTCAVPDTTKLTPQNERAKATLKAKPRLLPTDSAKLIWDKAMLVEICRAFNSSEKKLPDGEPQETAQKLQRICNDKRLNE